MKHWKLSIMLGVLYSILIFYFGYAMLNGTMGMWKGTLLFYAMFIPISIYGIYYARKKGEGLISFKEAFFMCLVIIIVGVFISQIANAIYLSTITEQEQDAMMDNIVESQLETVEYMNIDELEFEDRLRHQMKGMFEINAITIATSIFSVFFIAFMGLIVSLIMRRETSPT